MLGLRDWLAAPGVWLLVEWPERAPDLAATLDLAVELTVTGPTARRVDIAARSALGVEALRLPRQENR